MPVADGRRGDDAGGQPNPINDYEMTEKQQHLQQQQQQPLAAGH